MIVERPGQARPKLHVLIQFCIWWRNNNFGASSAHVQCGDIRLDTPLRGFVTAVYVGKSFCVRLPGWHTENDNLSRSEDPPWFLAIPAHYP